MRRCGLAFCNRATLLRLLPEQRCMIILPFSALFRSVLAMLAYGRTCPSRVSGTFFARNSRLWAACAFSLASMCLRERITSRIAALVPRREIFALFLWIFPFGNSKLFCREISLNRRNALFLHASSFGQFLVRDESR